mmetsp:Transcript_40623/g.99783  ORF Transcript_40623/g.99783 Transcript_40623/m.99783 type:complete len:454 (+) Transcript_40623:306-1667(+)|eukprot:CAMPEP_0206273488 /NCGR_PEP_ID=MMETSP0047_2-20121206/34628_1 /ASSEMBLY_ACC=CAM_ASM_000192 /TAXON_ID=195065 /ORGANISM="Chroomonas mesostigmatica_cf, Strain CCMP1168" /LENGTH=453 /DNA_ID=CAMNT_0053702599 /DNA_START=217 /DNA_END=1578 /DNA_ORIENTATION=-
MQVSAAGSQPTTKRKTKREQWFSFQKIWLANLRRELLGTDEHFGNPFCDVRDESYNAILPDLANADGLEGGLPKRTLILDLDETLVHTEFDQSRGWITHRRPHVNKFLAEMAKHFELVCFTSGLKQYATPIIDQLDPHRMISHRLYRDHTLSMKGIHVKDLARLNRDLARTIIVDNSPESYLLQPENAIPIKPFFGDLGDTSLLDLIPFLMNIVDSNVIDVRSVLKKCHLKGRFAKDSSKKRKGEKEHGRDRKISDIGLAPPEDESPDGNGARIRSLSDVDHRQGLQLWENLDEIDGSWANPIILCEHAPDHHAGLLVGPASHMHLAAAGHGPATSPAAHFSFHKSSTLGDLDEYLLEHRVSTGEGAEARMDAHYNGYPASRRRDGDGEEGGMAAGDKNEGEALMNWSAVHGTFAEVLRGMSPPPSMGHAPKEEDARETPPPIQRDPRDRYST